MRRVLVELVGTRGASTGRFVDKEKKEKKDEKVPKLMLKRCRRIKRMVDEMIVVARLWQSEVNAPSCGS